MPTEIHVYFEGDESLRPGFKAFFRELSDRAAKKRRPVRFIPGRSRDAARKDFETALRDPTVWPVLLIDSEGPVRRTANTPNADQTFWMVEMMEAWFHADKEALAMFYRNGFRNTALKPNPKVEEIPKADLERGLKAATRGCQKGAYHKTSHAPKLLELIRPDLVRQAAPNCDRLFKAILNYLH